MSSIAKYNDLIRQSFINPEARSQLEKEGCRYHVHITSSLDSTLADKFKMLVDLASINNFKEGNDPYGEHDFIPFTFEGHSIIAKFDYYTPDLEHGSDNPEDLTQTVRVLTIMLAGDY